MSRLIGIDVSQWQLRPDWHRVAEHCAFAFTKATDGPSFVNPTFAYNWVNMRKTSLILRGAYHFAQPGDPVEQARHYVDTVEAHGGFGLGTVAALDAEVALHAHGPSWIDAWCREVERLTGLPSWRVIVYSSLGWFDSYDSASDLNKRPLWIAEYASHLSLPRGVHAWSFWQFSQTYRMPGVATLVDCSVFHGTRAQLAALGGRPSGTALNFGKILGGALLGAAALAGANHATIHHQATKPKRPTVVAPAHVSGHPTVDGKLTCNAKFAGATSVRWAWLSNGHVLTGHTARTHVDGRGQLGRHVACRATGVNSAGATSTTSGAHLIRPKPKAKKK